MSRWWVGLCGWGGAGAGPGTFNLHIDDFVDSAVWQSRPFLSTDGGVYLIASTGAQASEAWSSSDPPDENFTQIDLGSSPVYFPLDVYQVGDVLHVVNIATFGGSAGEVRYYTYTMSTNTWSSGEVVRTGGVVYADAGIAVRSNGEVVVFYRGVNTGGGSPDARLYYRIRSTGGTWGTATVVYQAATAIGIQARAILTGTSGRLHLVYEKASNVIAQRTLTSSDTLGTESAVLTTNFQFDGYYNKLWPVDGTPDPVQFSGRTNFGGTYQTTHAYFNSADTPSGASLAQVSNSILLAGFADDGTTKWAIYGTNSSGAHVFLESTTGTTWAGTAEQVITAHADTFVSAGSQVRGINRFTRAGREVIAWVTTFPLNAGGQAVYYSEYEI